MSNSQNEIPEGLSMALAQNSEAMEHFSKMSKAQRMKVVDMTSNINSKIEMAQFAEEIAEGKFDSQE